MKKYTFQDPEAVEDFFKIDAEISSLILYHGTSDFFGEYIEQNGFKSGHKFISNDEFEVLEQYFNMELNIIPSPLYAIKQQKGFSFTKNSLLAYQYALSCGGNYQNLTNELRQMKKDGYIQKQNIPLVEDIISRFSNTGRGGRVYAIELKVADLKNWNLPHDDSLVIHHYQDIPLKQIVGYMQCS